MSVEIKTMDVENFMEEPMIRFYAKFGWTLKSSQRVFNQNSRPVATISDGTFTYVQTKTDTVDFTKLVFERDTNMKNYYELKMLEDEYETVEYFIKKTPFPGYSSSVSFEDWVEKENPSVYDGGCLAFIGTFFLVGVVTFAALAAIGALKNHLPYFEHIANRWVRLLIVSLITAILIGFVRAGLVDDKERQEAMKDPSSFGYKQLLEKYQKMHEQALQYENYTQRRKEILERAEELSK